MCALGSNMAYLAPPCAFRRGFLARRLRGPERLQSAGSVGSSLHSGHLTAIHDAGNVSTIAGMFSPHPLQRITKSRQLCGP